MKKSRPQIQLGEHLVTPDSRPYVIAEIGVNHEGSLQTAKELVRLASAGGADAAKFQTYKAGMLASRNSPAYWDMTKESTTSQFELFKKYDGFGEAEYLALASYCHDLGIDFLSTPFDNNALDLLLPLMPFCKVASADITNFPFLARIAQAGKPVVLSTGASNLEEVHAAVDLLRDHGCREIALLHCILNYPTPEQNANLDMIFGLQDEFPELVIGYSDHTVPDEGMLVLTAAYAKGARIIEKHFTNDKTLAGNDHYHAMDGDDLQTFIENVDRLRVLSGSRTKRPIVEEQISRLNARRSIVLGRSLSAGAPLSEAVITCKRPGTGISPTHWHEVLGRKVARDLDEDDILQWSDLE